MSWIEDARRRLDACVKKQKARDERIIRGWDEFQKKPEPMTLERFKSLRVNANIPIEDIILQERYGRTHGEN